MKNIQPKLKLKHARVIKPAWFDNPNIAIEDYRDLKKTKSTIRGITTPRKIQMYRWWFRYLQLALELEELDFTFTEHRRMSRKNGKKGYDKEFRHKVIVNRDRYIGWDLDELMTTNFDKWWKKHSHLFVETLTQTVELSPLDEIVAHDHYRYFRVDTRMTTGSIVRSLREQLGKNRRATKWTSQWTPTGEYRQEKLFNCYNGLVMWLRGKTTEEILRSGLFRKSRGQEIKYEVDYGSGDISRSKFHTKTEYERDRTGKNMERVQRDFYTDPGRRKGVSSSKFKERGAKANLDKMRKEILMPARRFVLIAADGYFAKHPRNKKYFGK